MNDFATDDKASTSSSCQIFSKIDDSRVENLQFSSCSNTPCNKDKDSRQFKSVSDFCSHFWESRSHVRPTFCNFCQEPLSGMVWTGLCCQICKLRCHKHCAPDMMLNFPCKWTTRESMRLGLGRVDLDNDQNFDDTRRYLHQWLKGNLAVNSKCVVCDGVCGSLLRLQDYKCVWCKVTIHESCKKLYVKNDCTLGQCPNSTLNPYAVRRLNADGACVLRAEFLTSSTTENAGGNVAAAAATPTPLLILVNTRSGDGRRGVDVLKKCKRLLNPLQVYDLSNGGADFGLKLFSQLPTFRILICGGDGTVGWVLMCLDRLNLLAKCQVGVLPLGTGNDLSRVLGWGRSFEKIHNLPSIIRKMERSRTKLLDRWSILAYEDPKCRIRNSNFGKKSSAIMGRYQESVAHHISQVLSSQDYSVVISSSQILCETVKNFITDVGNSLETFRPTANIDGGCSTSTDFNISEQCEILRQKLDNLVSTLKQESLEAKRYSSSDEDRQKIFRRTDVVGDSKEFVENSSRMGSIKKAPRKEFVQREHLMSRADSLKKAVKQIIDQASKAIDEQNEQTISSSSNTNRRNFLAKLSPPAKFKLSASASPLTATSTTSSRRRRPDLPPPSSSNSSIGASISDARDYSTADSVPDDPIHTTATTSTFSERNASGSDAIKKGLLSGGLTGGGSLIAEVLMLNSNVLNFGKLTPDRLRFSEEEPPLLAYSEKKVMNNYFGVGLDAKIALDFHNKRELCADKTRSRSKLFMMYGVLAGKELMHKTFKNLDQRIALECDGKLINLPQLQGIVVLNIPSYQGGANFWGGGNNGGRQDETSSSSQGHFSARDAAVGSRPTTTSYSLFQSQAVDDGLLEVVAVFGVLHCATSRLIKLHNHRIAQCQKVKITIAGSEPLPVQVDGEAWLQSAGFIQIVHKNRAKVLVSDKC